MTASRRPHPVRRQLRAVEHQDEAAAARLIAIRDERRELFEWAYRRKIEASGRAMTWNTTRHMRKSCWN